MNHNCDSNRPPEFEEAVLKPTNQLPDGAGPPIKGYDFNDGVDYDSLFQSFLTTGFQATQFARGVDVINMMINKRKETFTESHQQRNDVSQELHPLGRPPNACTIFLAYTSNMATCGVRETIRYLAQHNLVDVLVTSAGGIEEDFLKCFGSFNVGEFDRWRGQELRDLGVNRTGNVLVPNDHYITFENWLLPLLDKLLEEQQSKGINWTPSKIINRLGKEIANEDSIYYWCYVNKIPVFCPGITDGAMGDVLFSHTYRSPGLRVDIVEDIRCINLLAIYANSTGMIVLGGGIIKHHTFNANLMRNGADYCVLVNTGQEFDGSDAGARPDEAVSWGKIKGSADPVKICADASFIFPLLVSRTFALDPKPSMKKYKRIS